MTTNVTVTGTTATVTDDGTTVTVTAASTSTPAWGSISGTLANQTDLTSALAAKAATVGLWLPGLTGNFVSAPDVAQLDITGDIDLRVDFAPDTWANQRTISKWDGATQKSYMLDVNGTANLILYWSADGSTTISKVSTAAVSASSEQRKWIRATLDVDNGAGGNDVKFYTSDDGVTWTQLGATVTTAGTTSIFSGTTSLNVGAQSGVFMAGKLYRAIVKNGIDGTTVANLDLTNGVGPRIRDSVNNLWTINGTANGWQA